MPVSDVAILLDSHTRRLHRSLIDAVLTTGSVPSLPALAAQLATTPEAIRHGIRALAAGDYLACDADGQLQCLYPLSVTPTPHEVFVNGARRFAMCAIDALGMPAMLDRELEIAGHCAVCDTPIAIRVRPGVIVARDPSPAMVVTRRDEAEPAHAACCPFTVFVCGPKHANRLVHRIAETHALSLVEALTRAEEIFAGLLAEELPIRRPRGMRWGKDRDA